VCGTIHHHCFAGAALLSAGLLFVVASVLSLIRVRQVRWPTARDLAFLLGLGVTFVLQLLSGLDVVGHPGDSGMVNNLAIVVIVCFLIGIARPGS
jgi:cytochrome c oxidase assembly factor CtaG